MAVHVSWALAQSPARAFATYVEGQDQRGPQLPATSLLDRFAEELSLHGDIARASTAIRVPAGTGVELFNTLCRRLGPQAR